MGIPAWLLELSRNELKVLKDAKETSAVSLHGINSTDYSEDEQEAFATLYEKELITNDEGPKSYLDGGNVRYNDCKITVYGKNALLLRNRITAGRITAIATTATALVAIVGIVAS